jgi:ribosomal protein L37AE/L43A
MKLAPGTLHVRKHHKVNRQLWVCVGCGKTRAHARRTYCEVCKERLAGGGSVDVDDFPTWRELLRLRRVLRCLP